MSFTPHEAFAATFKPRSAAQDVSVEDRRHASLLRAVLGSDHAGLSEYQGFYFKSFYTYLGGRRIKRELAHWHYDNDVLVSSAKQRYLGEDETDDAALRFIT